MEHYFRNGLAGSTQKVYKSGKNRYISFCSGKGLSPLPASEHQLCQFVSSLANNKLSHSSMKCYLAAVRHLHIAEGYGDPHINSMVKLEQVMKGIRSLQSKCLKKTPRLPITPELLLKLKEMWSKRPELRDGSMLWAAATLCFFGFLRSGEITIPADGAFDEGAHLTFSDISADSLANPRVLRVRVKASKTDPFRVGVDVFVGKTDNSLCPVSAVLAYVTKRGPGAGPFFTFRDGRALTWGRLVLELKRALTAAGVNCASYSGHSFRSGAATTAAKQGFSDSTIKTLGRWKSNAYQVYIKTPRSQLAAVSQQLVRSLS